VTALAVNIADASAYIALNCIDVEDWTDADAAKKLRVINVASRTLTAKYPKYTIPDNAVYEFANILAIVFSDTNKLAQQGVKIFDLSGTVSLHFDSTGRPGDDLSRHIPKTSADLINADAANIAAGLPNVGSGRSVKWTVI
jgi:hypothetical protein